MINRLGKAVSRLKLQTGAVLVVSLILLLLMTIIGITAMQTTVLQEKMSGNVRDLDLAFEATESALRLGESWVDSRLPPKPDPVTTCTAPCQVVFTRDALNPSSVTATWDTDSVRPYAGTSTIPNVSAQPEYYIEHELFLKDNLNQGTQNDYTGRDLYRITARGTGGNATTQVIVRTTYARRF